MTYEFNPSFEIEARLPLFCSTSRQCCSSDKRWEYVLQDSVRPFMESGVVCFEMLTLQLLPTPIFRQRIQRWQYPQATLKSEVGKDPESPSQEVLVPV